MFSHVFFYKSEKNMFFMFFICKLMSLTFMHKTIIKLRTSLFNRHTYAYIDTFCRICL